MSTFSWLRLRLGLRLRGGGTPPSSAVTAILRDTVPPHRPPYRHNDAALTTSSNGKAGSPIVAALLPFYCHLMYPKCSKFRNFYTSENCLRHIFFMFSFRNSFTIFYQRQMATMRIFRLRNLFTNTITYGTISLHNHSYTYLKTSITFRRVPCLLRVHDKVQKKTV